jgi:hypothetical protein
MAFCCWNSGSIWYSKCWIWRFIRSWANVTQQTELRASSHFWTGKPMGVWNPIPLGWTLLRIIFRAYWIFIGDGRTILMWEQWQRVGFWFHQNVDISPTELVIVLNRNVVMTRELWVNPWAMVVQYANFELFWCGKSHIARKHSILQNTRFLG